MASDNKTPGQLAYEEDVRRKPEYPDGCPRPSWDDIPDYAKKTWEKNPTPHWKEKA